MNELKGVNLLSEDCPIRFIITVNALKEGWDCPFAYVLASLANRTSRVDVEQIVGRILRLPHTRQNKIQALNMSYVLTSSGDFKSTLDNIVRGLNSAGFSEKDYRAASDMETEQKKPEPPPPLDQTEIPEELNEQEAGQGEDEDFLNFDPHALGRELERREHEDPSDGSAERMLHEAERTGQAYEQEMTGQSTDSSFDSLSWEVKDKLGSIVLRVGDFWPRRGEVTPSQTISKQISIDQVGSPCDRLVWPERPQGASPQAPCGRSGQSRPVTGGRYLSKENCLSHWLAHPKEAIRIPIPLNPVDGAALAA